MDYVLSFMEGIITFVSPCMLPMLPIYISYFAGAKTSDNKDFKNKTIINALGFVLGLSIVFILLGAVAGTFGKYIKLHTMIFNIVGGLLLIAFGLNYMDIFKFNFLNKSRKLNVNIKSFNFLSFVLFGIVFSIGWTPCVGAFLGSALLLAANSHDSFKGIIMLLLYSLGLGIPFIISALLLDNLKQTFNFIKRNYKIINMVCGLLLVIIGLLMMFGLLNLFLSLLTFK
jgi:cytochrome c-type biogenesis protein